MGRQVEKATINTHHTVSGWARNLGWAQLTQEVGKTERRGGETEQTRSPQQGLVEERQHLHLFLYL